MDDLVLYCFENITQPAFIYSMLITETTARCEICSKLTRKTPERSYGVFVDDFEHISHLVLAFLLLTSNMQLPTV